MTASSSTGGSYSSSTSQLLSMDFQRGAIEGVSIGAAFFGVFARDSDVPCCNRRIVGCLNSDVATVV